MVPQENINNMVSKMTEALQAVRECEALLLEEIKQMEQLQEKRDRMAEEIAALEKELILKQREVEVQSLPTAPEVVTGDEPAALTPAPAVVPEKHGIETLADKFHGHISIHDKMTAQPETTATCVRVSDIGKAISINDRLLFIKELFGNAEVFTNTVKHLNGLQNFDEAQQYLAETFPHLDNTGNTAQLFLSIIRRRYL
jgi:hypothetical protein